MLQVKAVDGAALKTAIEGRDGKMLASFYTDDAVVRVIDRNNPPSKPREIHGRQAIATFWDDICSRAMTHKVDATGYLYDDRSGDPLLGPWVREWLALDKAEDTKRRHFWLPDDLFGKDGSFVPDDLLGNKRPDDYERTVVLVMTVTHSERPDEKTLFADMRPAEAADKNSRNLVSLRKGENDPHVAGFSASGWSSTSQQFVSPSHARSYIERCAVERGLVAVPAHELPKMPPAPEGMSRWYMIAKPE